MDPVVAIVGRPNVGKSTLFNRLVGGRRAIVEDEPGVTRDRHYATFKLDGRRLHLVDTGGFEPGVDHGIESLIRRQTQAAIDEADLVLVLLDARDGLLASDRDVVDALRSGGKPVIHVANKVDGPTQEAAAGELYAAGLPSLVLISALHGLGLDELTEAMTRALPPLPEGDATGSDIPSTGGVSITLVGRPNVGKSSLLNHLCGEERSIVSATPGTTRDPVDVLLQTPRGQVLVVDTAGIRRRARVSEAMESYAIIRALRSIDRADVACLLLDATAELAVQDARIANLALDAGKGLVLVFTKSDLVDAATRNQRKEEVLSKLRFVPWAPQLFISSKTGAGVKRLLPLVHRVFAQCGRRITTGELNQCLERWTAEHPPPTKFRKPMRFYYITQPETHPQARHRLTPARPPAHARGSWPRRAPAIQACSTMWPRAPARRR